VKQITYSSALLNDSQVLVRTELTFSCVNYACADDNFHALLAIIYARAPHKFTRLV